MRENTNTPYSNKLKFAFVELPKFNKREEELETHFDKWLYLLKHLSELKDRPALVQGEIFEKLLQLAEIKRLTEEDMEKYRNSVTDYYDVQLAMDYASEKARNEALKEEKISVIQKCLQMNMPIETIVSLTGYSKKQIALLANNR